MSPSTRNASRDASDSRFWDHLAPSYDQREVDPVYMAAVSAVVRALSPKSGESILDAGCGTGIPLTRYLRPDLRVTALDFSQRSLEAMEAKLLAKNVHFQQGDITELPFEDVSFDRSLCANTIQHLRTAELREKAVSELARVTRPGGIVVVSVHQWSIGKQRAGWKKEGRPGGVGQPDYIYRFDSGEFETILSSFLQKVRVFGAGFAVPRKLRLLEPLLQSVPNLRNRAHMLVGVGMR